MTCTKLEQRAVAAMPMISPCDDIPICVLIHLHRNQRAGKQEGSNEMRVKFSLFIFLIEIVLTVITRHQHRRRLLLKAKQRLMQQRSLFRSKN